MGSQHAAIMSAGQDHEDACRQRRELDQARASSSRHHADDKEDSGTMEDLEQAEMWMEYGKVLEDLGQEMLCPFLIIDLSCDGCPVLFASSSMHDIDPDAQRLGKERTPFLEYVGAKAKEPWCRKLEEALEESFVEWSGCLEWEEQSGPSRWLHVSLRQDEELRSPFVTVCFYEVTSLVEGRDGGDLEERCREVETAQLGTHAASFAVLHGMMDEGMKDNKEVDAFDEC
eukprot:757386-Hanusia_phi.AAC.2